MTDDEDTHKKIQEDISNIIKKENIEVHCSHGKDGGDIKFFRKINEKKIDLARPDILLIRKKDNHVLIIEIELRNYPKHLMGVACAICLSGNCIHKGENINIEKKSLLLVLDSNNVCKGDSGKSDQIKELKALIRKTLNFKNFYITTDKKSVHVINAWADDNIKDDELCG